MPMTFVQDYGNNEPDWAYFYNDNLGNHLQIGGLAPEKIYDFLIQTNVDPYVQFYLYPSGLDIKPFNGSDLTSKLYFTANEIYSDFGRGYSHYARIYSDGLTSSFISQNAEATYVSKLYSSLSNAGIDIYSANYAIFGEANINEAYIGVQNNDGSAVIYLDTANIPPTAGNKDIVIREIEICSEGEKKKMLILASEPYSAA